MADDLNRFLNFLFEADTGYVYSPLKRNTGEWEQNFFQWPVDKQALTDWITSSSMEGNVYISPALWKDKSATKESFKHSNVAWVEFDGSQKIDYKEIASPDVVIQTSSDTHTHCYWKIKPANGTTVENINRRLTYYFRADNSGWDCTQVLRPPGTLNHKYAKPLETKIVKFDKVFLKRDFSIFDNAPEIEKPPLEITYDDLIDADHLIVDKKFSPDISNMISKELAPLLTRSTFLMRLGYILASENCTELEIISLLYKADCRIKKFVGRSDQLMRLSEIAAIATLNIAKELEIEGYSPLEIINHESSLVELIPGWLHTTGIMMVTGQPGVGKTQYCFDIAHKLATGSKVHGKAEHPPVKVAVLSLEMDIMEAKYIFLAQGKVFSAEPTVGLWNENLRIYAPEADMSNFSAYEKVMRDFKPQVLIIDSLSELAAEDLKESEARTIMRWIRRMTKEYECAIILIHHNRKASDGNKKPRKLGDVYGSYIFAKTVSTVISLWEEEAKGYIELDPLKVRFGKKETIKVIRTEHLTFEGYSEDANRQSRTIQGNTNPLLNFNT